MPLNFRMAATRAIHRKIAATANLSARGSTGVADNTDMGGFNEN
jgi:hypothetical protein